jgi:hypothetical protein
MQTVRDDFTDPKRGQTKAEMPSPLHRLKRGAAFQVENLGATSGELSTDEVRGLEEASSAIKVEG